MKFKDYYELMGVARDATQDDIKRAYRRLARKYHPDVSKEDDAEERFKEIGEAYEVLRDPEKRAAYDELGSRWKEGQEFRPPPDWDFQSEGVRDAGAFSDFFENLFGGASGHAGGRRSTFRGKGFDRQADVGITLEEAFRGAERTLSLEQVVSGADGRPQSRTRQLNVRIPAGVTEGQQIRLAGQGDPGIGGGPSGDLFLRVRLLPHGLFKVNGKDVELELPVTPWEAALGATVRVPTLVGKVDLRIPKGSQSGQQLRLKGKGLAGKPPGDQHVVLKVVTPAAQNEAQEELYREMAKIMPMNPRESLERES
ncbi:MAG TPA: DnaJ C-terminal domain-containing protein [Gammaproteobacteria bacterium]|nr:DnaJ C-terminal domain-containing protein [Gammaproteobacteria bacterium]